MDRMIRTMIGAFIARFIGLWTKLKMLLNPSVWIVRLTVFLRTSFMTLFDMRPRHKGDYYPLLLWLVSKRLAFALVIVVGLFGLWYVFAMSPLAPAFAAGTGTEKLPTYRYNSLPLKFYSGMVRVLDADGRQAYVGTVSGGRANGAGKVFDADGALLYVGTFKDSMYEGSGERYYPSGALEYKGDFSQNRFHGEGAYYRQEGTLEYAGDYVSGVRQGNGSLYDAGGKRIFTGPFLRNDIVYEAFVGKTAPEAAEMYGGRTLTYATADSYCVRMDEIGAGYAARSGENSVDEEWKLERVYILSDSVRVAGKDMRTIREIADVLGDTVYLGETRMTFADAVFLNALAQERLPSVDMTLTQNLDEVYTVDAWDENRDIYIYVFQNGEFVYTFYCESGTATGFLMYSVE